jgi:hypothetical protein
MNQKWFRLLHEQQYGKGITSLGPAPGGRVGLSPAFLVGAIRPQGAPPNPAGRAELLSLLRSMSTESSGNIVHITECADIHQPRASLTDGAMGHLGDSVLGPDGSPSHLYASPAYFMGAGRNVESLTDGLWAILGSDIAQGNYSYREGAWRGFADFELEFIDRALKDDDA